MAVNRAIRYAYNTRFLALEFGGLPHEFYHPDGPAPAGPAGPAGPADPAALGLTSVQAASDPSDVSSFMLNAADASHANNPDRRSTMGILFRLFGGPIFWKSVKQSTVATSTTEAELLALSAGSKELLALGRLIHQIQLKIPSNTTHTMTYDNV